MEIKLALNKDVNENANIYFNKSKKLKSKIPGINKAIEQTLKEIEEFESKKQQHIDKKQKEEKLSKHIKKEWYDKFRYTKTPSELLFVIGKDASSNEILIKKHAQENDLVFHTEAPGSPFGILKDGKTKASKEEILGCAQFLGCFSQQWKKGYGTADIFWVYPEQVTKKAQSGEFIAKGAFMIYGEKNILKNIPLQIALGKIEHKIPTEDETIEYEEPISGPEQFIKQLCKTYVKIEPGKSTYKAMNKEIQKRLKLRIDELPKYIPNNSKILKK